MSYKIGFILSFLFVCLFFVFGIDLINIQFIYTELDSKAVSVGYYIAKRGSLEPEFIKSLEEKYNVTFTCLDNCTPSFGDVVEYTLSLDYHPLVIQKESLILRIKRSTVIGYYE